MNREQRRREARQYRAAPVTRTQRKQRGLAFLCGFWFGMIAVLSVAVMAGVA